MHTVSLIFEEQPELTEAFKKNTALLVESIMDLLCSVEFLLAERGELEGYIISVIRKVQIKKRRSKDDVCITFVSETPLTVCSWGDVCVDRVEFFQCTGRESVYWALSPLHRYMIERSRFVICCAVNRPDSRWPLAQYAAQIKVPAFNLQENNGVFLISSPSVFGEK